MAYPKLARNILIKFSKTIFFIFITIGVGRTIGEPYDWVSHDLILKIGHIFSGADEIGAENIDDIYFYINFIVVIAISVVLYGVIMKLINVIKPSRKGIKLN